MILTKLLKNIYILPIMRSELLTIAVTGANGFVGSNLVRFLKNKKCSVREIQKKIRLVHIKLNQLTLVQNGIML